MSIDKQSSVLRTAIGGTKALIGHMANYAPEALKWQNVKSLGKLYLQGLFSPFKNAFTNGNAEKELMQAAKNAKREIRSNMTPYIDGAKRQYLDNVVKQGPENFQKLTHDIGQAIARQTHDPRIGEIAVYRTTPRDWSMLEARKYKMTGNYADPRPATRGLDLDDFGSVNPGTVYHELGHLTRTRLGNFLFRHYRADKPMMKTLEEARASYTGYRKMLQDGYTAAQAAGTFRGLPSYIYGELPYYTAKAGEWTTKYGIPAGAGGYALYNYMNRN